MNNSDTYATQRTPFSFPRDKMQFTKANFNKILFLLSKQNSIMVQNHPTLACSTLEHICRCFGLPLPLVPSPMSIRYNPIAKTNNQRCFPNQQIGKSFSQSHNPSSPHSSNPSSPLPISPLNSKLYSPNSQTQ